MRTPTLLRNLLFALLFIVGVLVAGCSGSGLGGDAPAPTVAPEASREAAPAFSLPALEGSGQITLASLRGRPALINFWASWCPPCEKETPDLIAFARTHPRMQVLGIASDDERGEARAFARRYAIPYPLALDRDGAVLNAFQALGLPGTYVLDAEGRIASYIPSIVTREVLEDLATQMGVG